MMHRIKKIIFNSSERETIRLILFFVGLLVPSLLLAKNEMRVEANFSVAKAYVGQVVCFDVTFYTSDPEISYVSLLSNEKVDGIKIISAPEISHGEGNLRSNIERNGSENYSAVVYRVMFIPEKAGTIFFPSLEFVVGVQKPTIINHPFFGRVRSTKIEDVNLSTKSLRLKVNPLPKAPLSFSGAIGDFKIEGSVPPGKIYSGGECIVVYTITGFGNIEEDMLLSLKREFPSSVKLKSETRENHRQIDGGKLYNEMESLYTFELQEDGIIELPSVEFTYFNPATNSYLTAKSQILKIHVDDSELPSRPRVIHSI